jgi:two-component sensor histidine kinase
MGVTSLIIPVPQGQELDQRSSQAKADVRLCDVCDFVRESDHRIANHLAMLSGYVGLKQRELAGQSGTATSAPVQLAFEGIRTQIEAVSRLHRSLSTRTQGAGIDLGEYIHEVCAPFMSGLSGAIELTEDLQPGCLVRGDQILPLTQIVSEVITNAIKYSHVGGETGKVSVRCHSVTDKELEIEIVDDGSGLPQRFDPLTAKGLGFRLIRVLTARIGAQSGFESSAAGTRFWLRMEPALEDRGRRLRSNGNGHAQMGDTSEHVP